MADSARTCLLAMGQGQIGIDGEADLLMAPFMIAACRWAWPEIGPELNYSPSSLAASKADSVLKPRSLTHSLKPLSVPISALGSL